MGITAARMRAACGLVGPAAFTAAWALATARQPGYSIANEHISGLAAPDANVPGVMTAGFVALGLGTIVFASQLDRRLGGPGRSGVGPLLLGLSGVATTAAGVLRRDRMSNYPMPGDPLEPQSWRNDGHDLASVIGHASAGVGMLALAARFTREPGWRGLAAPVAATVVTSTGLMAAFARDVTRPGNGIVQRVGITVPVGAMGLVAWKLLRDPERDASPGAAAPQASASPGTSARVRSTSTSIAATSSSIES
ncbi:MAG: DUF998 domain-containing protein [Actinomycetota bacterium]